VPLTAVAVAPVGVLLVATLVLSVWTGTHRVPGAGRSERRPRGAPRLAFAAAGLAAAFAAASWQLTAVAGGGSVVVPLWSLAPHLPLTIRADPTAATLLLILTVCAGLAGLGRCDRAAWVGPVTLAAVAAGAVAVSAGDLVTLWVGLVLANVASFGLAWRAEAPDIPARVWMGAVLTFAADLGFLAAVLAVWRAVGTTDYAVIPTGTIAPGLLALLLAPGVVRLAGAWMIPVTGLGGSRGALPGAGRGWWFGVTTVPVGLAVIIRVTQLSAGSWPPRPITGGLAALAILVAAAGSATAIWPRGTVARGVRGSCLAQAGLALAGFAEGGPDGLVLGTTAALVVAFTVIVLPALPGWARAAPGGGLTAVIRLAAASALPPSLGLGVGVLLVALASTGARPLGLAVALTWVGGLPATAATAGAIRRAVTSAPSRERGPRPAYLGAAAAAGLLVAAACVPGVVLRIVAPSLVGAGAAGSRLAASHNWISDGIAGVSWPGGDLAVLLALGGALWWSVGVLGGARAAPGTARGRPSPSGRPDGPTVTEVAAARLRSQLGRLLRVGLTTSAQGAGLAARAIREQPRWLWLTTVAWLAWLLVVR